MMNVSGETLEFAAFCVATILALGWIAFAVYCDATAETFSLRKDCWVCTKWRTALKPMTTVVGNTVIVTTVPQQTCIEWTAR